MITMLLFFLRVAVVSCLLYVVEYLTLLELKFMTVGLFGLLQPLALASLILIIVLVSFHLLANMYTRFLFALLNNPSKVLMQYLCVFISTNVFLALCGLGSAQAFVCYINLYFLSASFPFIYHAIFKAYIQNNKSNYMESSVILVLILFVSPFVVAAVVDHLLPQPALETGPDAPEEFGGYPDNTPTDADVPAEPKPDLLPGGGNMASQKVDASTQTDVPAEPKPDLLPGGGNMADVPAANIQDNKPTNAEVATADTKQSLRTGSKDYKPEPKPDLLPGGGKKADVEPKPRGGGKMADVVELKPLDNYDLIETSLRENKDVNVTEGNVVFLNHKYDDIIDTAASYYEMYGKEKTHKNFQKLENAYGVNHPLDKAILKGTFDCIENEIPAKGNIVDVVRQHRDNYAAKNKLVEEDEIHACLPDSVVRTLLGKDKSDSD